LALILSSTSLGNLKGHENPPVCGSSFRKEKLAMPEPLPDWGRNSDAAREIDALKELE